MVFLSQTMFLCALRACANLPFNVALSISIAECTQIKNVFNINNTNQFKSYISQDP